LYATYFILLQRMIEVHASLQATVVSHWEWNAWSESKLAQAKKCLLINMKQTIADGILVFTCHTYVVFWSFNFSDFSILANFE
jgi:hypothetical protein